MNTPVESRADATPEGMVETTGTIAELQSPSVTASKTCSQYPGEWLNAIKTLEKEAPKIKFSGETEGTNFERFMEELEESMDAEGVTDKLRVKHMENWFEGEALELVRSKRINDMKVDSATTFENMKEALRENYEPKMLCEEEVLRGLMKGGPIAKDNFKGIQTFLVKLQCQADLARGKGFWAKIFESKGTYKRILKARLPHLLPKWVKEFGEMGQKQSTDETFIKFVRDGAKLQEEITSAFKEEEEVAESKAQETKGVMLAPFIAGNSWGPNLRKEGMDVRNFGGPNVRG